MEKTPQEAEEANQKLLKEALQRANKKEKIAYEKVSKRQITIVERVLAILKEYGDLCAESDRNKHPETTPVTDGKSVVEMSTAEFDEWMARTRREFQESYAWSSKCLSIMSKQMKLIRELMELSIDLLGLERKEKWLLLSIVLRTQPNLLRYIDN